MIFETDFLGHTTSLHFPTQRSIALFLSLQVGKRLNYEQLNYTLGNWNC